MALARSVVRKKACMYALYRNIKVFKRALVNAQLDVWRGIVCGIAKPSLSLSAAAFGVIVASNSNKYVSN